MTTLVRRDPRRPDADLRLTADTIHLWTIRLDEADRSGAPLSTDERDRAARFRFDADRRRFVSARAAVRSILADYLGLPPGSVVFTTGPWGKPMLDPARHGPALRFNLSHSHELALVVVARDRDVGIDVERQRVLPDLERIVARFFSAAERAALERLSADHRPDVFFRLWTLKEAYLKASGDGFSRNVQDIVVDLDADEQRASVRALDRPDDHRRWQFFTLTPEAGYVAAIAVEEVPGPP
jgi:4'-phosphopantetheinyl transferase